MFRILIFIVILSITNFPHTLVYRESDVWYLSHLVKITILEVSRHLEIHVDCF